MSMSCQIHSNKKYFWILGALLLARCASLPILPLIGTTEGRYAQVSQQMVDSGDWVTPRLWFDGELVPFLGKPPLFFWSSAVSMKIFGVNEFAARLPSLISFAAILLLMWLVLSRYANSCTAWRAMFMCISSSVIFVSSGLVIVDMMLALGVAGALLAYYAFSQESDRKIRKRWSLTMFFLLALGFMTKGPVAVVLVGLPIFAWTIYFRKWRDLKDHAWFSGSILFLIIVAPWFYLAEMKNPGFLKYFFVNENFLRFVIRDYGDKYGGGHEYIRGTAIIMMIGAAFPWSIYGIYRLFKYRSPLPFKRVFNDNKMSFFFFVVVVDTIFWALARQLLITYMYPLVPLFMAWVAILIQQQSERTHEDCEIFNMHAFTICLIITIVLVIGIPVMSQQRSTKDIIEISSGHLINGQQANLYFVHSTPYSAYFYGKDSIITHPKETFETSLETISNNSFMGLIRDKYYKRLSDKDHQGMQVLEQYGKYILFRINYVKQHHGSLVDTDLALRLER